MKSTPKKGKKQTTTSSTKLVNSPSLKKYYYLLGLFTFFIFANTIGNGYNLDDGIVTNGHKLTSQGLSAIGEIFTSNYYSDVMGYAFGYRPMVHLSFAIEHELFGEKPGAGHFINVILFALTTILFFKLLVKWVGEKNLLFASIAAILFAVHPIHTEVVASLKNRDELLAFLFVLWSALAAHKYLEKGRWVSIVAVFVLFSCAMLSKKSVYPMAIVLPAAIILLKETSIKNLWFLALSFIIPAVVLGSEFQVERALLMLFVPAVSLISLFIIKSTYLSLSEQEIREYFHKLRPVVLPFIAIVIVSFLSIFFSSFSFLLFTIPLFFWLFKVNYEFGLITLIFLLVGLDMLWIESGKLNMLILIFGFGYGVHVSLQNSKINTVWISIGIMSVLYFVFDNYNIINAPLFISLLLLIFLLQKKRLWAVLFSVALCTASLIIGKITLYPILILLISVSFFLFQKTKNTNWIKYIAVIVFGITIGSIGYENLQSISSKQELVEESKVDKPKFVKNENILKEGRQLEFVENTLVASHTKEETIGTGFATLGEYFRLMVFPYELSFYYGYAKTDTHGLRNFLVWLFILVHIGMIVLAIFHIRKNPLVTIGVFWYLLCILLFSNWVELVAGMVGERLAFTASAGFCIFVTGILFWIKPDLNFKKPGILGYSLIAILIVFAGRTIIRNTNWKDTITLMAHDITHLENSSQANNIYAMHLMAESTNNSSLPPLEVKEMQNKAITHFDQATKVSPGYYNVYIDKARATMLTGDYEVGVKALEKAKEIDPYNPFTYYTMFDLLERTGDADLFLKNAKEFFELNKNEHAYGAVGRGHYLNGDYQKSKDILLEGSLKFPENESLKYNITLVEKKLN